MTITVLTILQQTIPCDTRVNLVWCFIGHKIVLMWVAFRYLEVIPAFIYAAVKVTTIMSDLRNQKKNKSCTMINQGNIRKFLTSKDVNSWAHFPSRASESQKKIRALIKLSVNPTTHINHFFLECLPLLKNWNIGELIVQPGTFVRPPSVVVHNIFKQHLLWSRFFPILLIPLQDTLMIY